MVRNIHINFSCSNRSEEGEVGDTFLATKLIPNTSLQSFSIVLPTENFSLRAPHRYVVTLLENLRDSTSRQRLTRMALIAAAHPIKTSMNTVYRFENLRELLLYEDFCYVFVLPKMPRHDGKPWTNPIAVRPSVTRVYFLVFLTFFRRTIVMSCLHFTISNICHYTFISTLYGRPKA